MTESSSATDQRGAARPYDADGDGIAVCDIGAYESADIDRDHVGDPVDNCLLVANATQINSDEDAHRDVCDNCVAVANPRMPTTWLQLNPWAVVTGGQRDVDFDGFGNKCDAKFAGLPSQSVGGLDLGQFRTSSGEDRRFDTCGTVGSARPCAIYDLDEATAGNTIGGLDLGRFLALSGSTPGPRCADCTGTGSVPLPCTAGTTGDCN